LTVNAGTQTFNAVSNAQWILLSYPGAPVNFPPSYSVSNFQTTTGLTVLYDTAVAIPSANTAGTVTISDTNGNSTTFTVTFLGSTGGTGGGSTGTVTVTPNPATLTSALNSGCCSQTTLSVNSTVSGTVSVSLSSSLGSNYLFAVVNANSITAGTPVTVTLNGNASGLSSQTYSGTLTVSVNSNGTVSQTNVPITYVVGTGGSGSVTATPNPVTLSAALSSSGQATVTVNSTVSGVLSVSMSSSLSNYVTPVANGSITAGTPVSVTLFGTDSGLSSQTLTGTLTVTVNSNGIFSQTTVQVNFVVGTGGSGSGGTGGTTASVAPTAITFSADMNNTAAISPQYLSITSAGTYSATAAASGGNGQWLSVGSGSVTSNGPSSPGLLEVIANPAGLAAGSYSGTVTVSSQGGSTQVNVTLTVYSASILYVATGPGGPSTMNVTESGGNLGTVPQLFAFTSGSTAMTVTASTTTPWLILPTTSGSTSTFNGGNEFQVFFSAASLANGVYIGAITFTSPTAADSPFTVQVVLSVSGSTVSAGLSLSQSSVTLNAAANGSSASQQVGVQANTADGFTATATVNNGGINWLTVNPNAGTAPQNITIIASPFDLPNGTYSGQVSVTDGTTTATILVTFTVGGSGSSGGNVVSSPSSLTFSYQINGNNNLTSQSLTISNSVSGSAGIPFSVSATESNGSTTWLTATVNGATQGQTQATVVVSITPGSLPHGTYNGTVTISPTGGNQISIPITLNILSAATVTATTATGSQLSFAYQVGGSAPGPGTIQVTGSTSNLTFSASASTVSGGNWLSVNNSTGATGTAPAALSVTVNPANLGPATYSGTVVVQGTGGAIGSSTISVQLTVTAPLPTISMVEQAASYAVNGPVSPGEIVSIYGSAMGPATPLGTTVDPITGKVETSLGNVQVSFNGYFAPLTYVSATQINCVVPYELAQITSPYVQIKYLNQTSNAFNLRAAATAPGIFTAGNGTGQAAALNSDNSFNSAGNPAPAGSVVQIYMTGEGLLAPLPPGVSGTVNVTGSITCKAGCTSLSQIPVPLLAVGALVNGQPATITPPSGFYGEAAGFVSGVMQVNVVIPPNTPSGPVSLVISVGGASSQAGVTVSIK
jgi:uncharacterized protein (TIGR03437 family)